MRERERLFEAIGGVDERLLARSETGGKRERLRDRLAWTAAVAACAAVVTLAWMWPAQTDPAPPEGPPPRQNIWQDAIPGIVNWIYL